MRVEVLSLPDHELSDYDYRDVVEIRVDGKLVWQVYDSEPEDNTLNRAFKDCRRVDALMRLAYDAGVRGEKFDVVKRKVSGDILWDTKQ